MLVFLLVIAAIAGVFAFFALSSQESPQTGALRSSGKEDYFAKAKAFYEEANLTEAEYYLRKAIKLSVSNIQAHMLLVQTLRRMAKKDALIHQYYLLLQMWDDGVRGFDPAVIQRDLADLLWDQKNYEECFFHYAVLQKNDVDGMVSLRLAWILASQGYYQKAVSYYEKLYHRNPHDPEIVRGLIPCFLGLKRFEEARDLFLDLIANGHEKNEDAYWLGKIFLELSDPDSAMKYLRSFLKDMNPPDQWHGSDALCILIPEFRKIASIPPLKEVLNWLEIFTSVCKNLSFKDQRDKEFLWQCAFFHLFSQSENASNSAKEKFQKLFSLDSSYKQVKDILHIFEQEPLAQETLKQIWIHLHEFPEGLFQNPRPIRAEEFYRIGLFSSGVVKEFLDPHFFGSIKSLFRKDENLSPQSLRTCSRESFMINLQKILFAQGYRVHEKLSEDETGVRYDLLLADKKEKLWVCSVFRTQGEIGEIEIARIPELVKSEMATGAIAISTGSFTLQASENAKKKNIRLCTLESLSSLKA